MNVTCLGCGKIFETDNIHKDRCNKNCGRKQNPARHQTPHIINFVGLDGEGVTLPDGSHRYVLLSIGEESFHRGGRHLLWDEIFECIYSHYLTHPKSTYVGFYLGYDFTQWFRTLPQERAAMLLTNEGIAARERNDDKAFLGPFPVDCRADLAESKRALIWEFDILGTSRFRLRPKGVGASWLYVCDSGPFWQCSFLTAIDPAAWPVPVVTPEEHAIILEGKAKRATAVFDENMIRYNVTENKILARAMTVLNEGFSAIGLRLKSNQWFGPGQAAQAWLDLIGAPTNEEVTSAVPMWAMQVARQTYYGGWFEIHAHGLVPGNAYEYDINSAYPAAIAELPCLLHGTWNFGSGTPPEFGYIMVHADVTGTSPRSGAMPHRTRKGGILRPHHTSGWYWQSEILAAQAAGFVDSWETDTWIEYQPCDCPPPMAAIRELYLKRLTVGKNSPQGRALKLVYNSAYGKFAQSIGNPKYGNSFYASLITSDCRRRILNAIATHPTGADSLLMVATDGIYFRETHSSLSIDPSTLGLWDETVLTNLSLFMPGVYWSDKTRAKIAAGDAPSLKSRGINARDLAARIADIDHAWEDFNGDEWPFLSIPVSFAMTTAKQALARGTWDTAGTISTSDDRHISADPILKRSFVHRDADLWRSTPHRESVRIETTPYNKTFGMELAAARDDQPITPDGRLDLLLAEMLR